MTELPKAYEPKEVDSKWYAFWEEEGFFTADPGSNKPTFSVSMPPPNVTGTLHMGHALGCTLTDILIRWSRMCGKEAVWIPGTDHAGIATQTVVERHLIKTIGKTRKEFSREEFLKHVWDWKEKSEARILNQLKKLGCSCDWSRLRFTMDEGCNRAVRTIFKKLYDEHLIYRGDYLVNWDPVTQTALADDEVEYEEQDSYLWYFNYPLKDGTGYATVATTRPETMLGDTAVAVSPKDTQYKDFVGRTVFLPLSDREIPIIADIRVDPEFGTGMVKITPAHDPMDYEIGIEHRLPFINIMTTGGKINENGGKFEGMTMLEARNEVVHAMDAMGLLVKKEPHTLRVGKSYRSKAVIEPYLSKQWFVRMTSFTNKLRTAVQEERVRLIPKNWENTYFHWIDKLRDWCISRQLWWGHRIPIWYHVDDPERMICYEGEGLPPQVEQNPDQWHQDEDVLDTWFSSAIWPFSILGWPEKTKELEKFYPNSTLVTGHDILFFWVARMIMMGEYVNGHPPFPEVYLHSLIYGKSYWRKDRDGGITYLPEQERIEYDLGKPTPKDISSKWEKMSKSKGNIIDPLEMIDQYGTDAIRMALCASASQTWEIDLDRRRFEEFKNFANKIWNGARFVFMNIDITAEELALGLEENLLNLEDKWILCALNSTVRDVNEELKNYDFDQAATGAYDFFWKMFCSYYVEIIKPFLFGKIGSQGMRKNKQKLLVIVLCQAIRLLHPMAPFITEELFQLLKEKFSGIKVNDHADLYTKELTDALLSPACIKAPYPRVIKTSDINAEIDRAFSMITNIVYTIRNIRGEMKITPGTTTDVHIVGQKDNIHFQTVCDNRHIIDSLVRVNKLSLETSEPEKGFAATSMVDNLKIIIPLPQEHMEKEIIRLEKEEVRLENAIEKIKNLLANSDFVKNAPKELIEKQKEQLEQSKKQIEEITQKLDLLKK